jgi:hypothetical protein
MSLSRRRFLAGSAALAVLPTATQAAVRRAPPAPFMLDDASRLNETPISRLAILTSSEDGRLLRELRATLGEAASEGRPVAFGGARHSMGGQSLPRTASPRHSRRRRSSPTPKSGSVACDARADALGLSPPRRVRHGQAALRSATAVS